MCSFNLSTGIRENNVDVQCILQITFEVQHFYIAYYSDYNVNFKL